MLGGGFLVWEERGVGTCVGAEGAELGWVGGVAEGCADVDWWCYVGEDVEGVVGVD